MTTVAIVTGSSGGIGSSVCRRLSDSGYAVFGLDQIGQSVSTDLVCDLGSPGFSKQIPKFDFGKVGLIVHTAAYQPLETVTDSRDDTWLRAFNVNIRALIELVAAFESDLRATRGTVISISSIHARHTSQSMSAYAASKAALESWTRSASLELGPEVAVLALRLGAIDTAKLREGLERFTESERHSVLQNLINRTPIGRLGSGAEVAEWVNFLASPAGRYATGTSITIDGGASARLSTE